MRCPKCGIDNRRRSKFCRECGIPLQQGSSSAFQTSSPAGDSRHEPPEVPPSFWRPDWRWHLRALLFIYIFLVVVYFALSLFLSKVPEPFKMRDIPKEMTPWLKR